MTTPANETHYCERGNELLCKGAPQSANTSVPAFSPKGPATQRPSGSVLHGRDDEPPKRANRDQAFGTGREAANEAVKSDPHAEAVTRSPRDGSAKGQRHGGLLLPGVSSVRERGNRPEARVSGSSIRRSDAAGVRLGEDAAHWWIDSPWRKLKDWEIDAALYNLKKSDKPFIPPYGPPKEWTEDELREQLAARQRKGGWS